MNNRLRRCTLNVADLRSGVPKTTERQVRLDACPFVMLIGYPYAIALDASIEGNIIDVTAINVELGSESLVCQIDVRNTCTAILFVVVAHTKLDDDLINCLYVHLCEIDDCRGYANVIPGANIPQTC